MRKTGPNDTSDASFGPKVCIFLFISCFTYLTSFFGSSRFYSHCKATGRIRLGCDEENRPKRCVLRHLGQRYVFFFFLFHVLLNLTIFCFVYLGSIHDLRRRGRFGWAAMGKTGPR